MSAIFKGVSQEESSKNTVNFVAYFAGGVGLALLIALAVSLLPAGSASPVQTDTQSHTVSVSSAPVADPQWEVKFFVNADSDVDPATEGDQPGLIVTGWSKSGSAILLRWSGGFEKTLTSGVQDNIIGFAVSDARIYVDGTEYVLSDTGSLDGGVILYYVSK